MYANHVIEHKFVLVNQRKAKKLCFTLHYSFFVQRIESYITFRCWSISITLSPPLLIPLGYHIFYSTACFWLKCNFPMTRSVCHNFLQGREVTLPCSCQSTCYLMKLLAAVSAWCCTAGSSWRGGTGSTAETTTQPSIAGVVRWCFECVWKQVLGKKKKASKHVEKETRDQEKLPSS